MKTEVKTPTQPCDEATAIKLVRKSLKPVITRKTTIEVRWTYDPASIEEGAFVVAKLTVPRDAGLDQEDDLVLNAKNAVFFVYFVKRSQKGNIERLAYNYALGPQKSCGNCRRFAQDFNNPAHGATP